MRLLQLALVAPEASEAHGGAEFPGFGLLLPCDCECGSCWASSKDGAPGKRNPAI